MKTLIRAAVVAAVAVAGPMVVAASPASAAVTYDVNVVADELDANPAGDLADLSLREAFQLASSDGQDSTIVLGDGAVYTLSRCGPADAEEDLGVDGDLDGPRGADGNLEISGRGARIVQACPGERVLHHIDDTHLHLHDLSLIGGDATLVVENQLGIGGGVFVGLGSLRLDRVTIVGNEAGVGGGLASTGTDLEVIDSTIANNAADFTGGGIAAIAPGVDLAIARSTLSNNRAELAGGVVAFGSSDLLDSTVVANTSSGTGPSGGGISGSGTWTIRGSVVAATSGGPDCSAGLVVVGQIANLDSDSTCFEGAPLAGRHPQLGYLVGNGGPTASHRPVVGSPVLDVIAAGECAYPVDQRGEPRPEGGSCDLGSVEEPPYACSEVAFPDVPATHPFGADVCWMAQASVTGGYDDGGFHPGAAVTRQSMAAFLYRFAMSPPFEAPDQATFADVGLQNPFRQEVEWLVEQEITGGYADGTYRPTAQVTRQAMAAFLARVAKGSGKVPAPPATPTFRDVPTGHPFYAEIQYVASAGVAGGYGDGTYRGGAPVSRQAMSAFLHRLAAVPNLAGI
jgi:hypothetical protein